MSLQNPPGFLQNAGDTHTAAQMRMYLASLQAGMSAGATSLRARGGVHPGFGQEFVVTQTGSPSMGVLVEPGAISIPGSLSSTQGNYFVINDAQVSLSVTAAHATLPRIDIVVVNVRDSFYSGASNDCQLQVIAGTPASSPVAPTAPDNSLTIASIAVGAAVSSITNANITDTRIYSAASGGVINIRNIAAVPASTEISEGQLLWAMDTNILYQWNGTAARQVWPVGSATGSSSAPIKLFQGKATATLTLTTSFADIVGATVTLTTTGANAIYIAVASFDAFLSAAGAGVAFLGHLIIDGVAHPDGGALFTQQTTGDRATISGTWMGTLASAGSHTLKLQGRKDTASGTLQFIGNSTMFTLIVIETA